MSALQVDLQDIASQFTFTGVFLSGAPYGNGHINDTYLLEYTLTDGSVRPYILQRINHHVFRNPKQLMENISRITGFVREKVVAGGGDPDRETMNLIPTVTGDSFFQDGQGYYWRAYQFIMHAISLERVEHPDEFYQSAVAFGNFQRLLSDFPAHTLHETIPNFHNTPDRYRRFEEVVSADPLGRAAQVEAEIAFIRQRREFTSLLLDAQQEGKLPLRVTHNDTKLNNVMLDSSTHLPVCVIDLDTVMPGFSVNDFGDSIRFGASTGAEDEIDLSKIRLDLSLFDQYTKGFLAGCQGALTPIELDLLPAGAKMMTLENGIRFLTDYLEGDTYFKIHREGQNLDRCRTQLKLVQEMEDHWDELREIVSRYR